MALYGIDLSNAGLIGEPSAHLVDGDSGVVFSGFRLPVHLLFIDGGHEHKTVRGDIYGWLPKVVVGGLVAYHDYFDLHEGRAPWIKGVKQAVDEWLTIPETPKSWSEASAVGSIRAFWRVAI
jgi:hypothetical protein